MKRMLSLFLSFLLLPAAPAWRAEVGVEEIFFLSPRSSVLGAGLFREDKKRAWWEWLKLWKASREKTARDLFLRRYSDLPSGRSQPNLPRQSGLFEIYFSEETSSSYVLLLFEVYRLRTPASEEALELLVEILFESEEAPLQTELLNQFIRGAGYLAIPLLQTAVEKTKYPKVKGEAVKIFQELEKDLLSQNGKRLKEVREERLEQAQAWLVKYRELVKEFEELGNLWEEPRPAGAHLLQETGWMGRVLTKIGWPEGPKGEDIFKGIPMPSADPLEEEFEKVAEGWRKRNFLHLLRPIRQAIEGIEDPRDRALALPGYFEAVSKVGGEELREAVRWGRQAIERIEDPFARAEALLGFTQALDTFWQKEKTFSKRVRELGDKIKAIFYNQAHSII